MEIPMEVKLLVDVDNLIDYMLIIFYTGNYDAPCTITRQNQPNNFYAIDNRNDKTKGFVFLIMMGNLHYRLIPYKQLDGIQKVYMKTEQKLI